MERPWYSDNLHFSLILMILLGIYGQYYGMFGNEVMYVAFSIVAVVVVANMAPLWGTNTTSGFQSHNPHVVGR